MRLKRVFNIDIETCKTCGDQVKVIACIRLQDAGGRAKQEAKAESRYRADGRNTLEIALKCGISADSAAEFRPTPRRSAG